MYPFGTALSLSLVALGASAPGPTVSSPPESPVAFVDVSVITMLDSLVHVHQTVIVDRGVITLVGSAASVTIPGGATVVPGAGRFLIPGLVDAHVHIMEPGDLPQFLAYGVTTVRNLTGSPRVLEWKAAVAQGTLVGPRIVTSGPIFAGPEVPWRNKVVFTDPAAARAEVRRQHEAGYDLIKIYDGVPAEVYAAVTDEARRLGMRVTGHIPREVHLAGVLRAGQDLEHTDKLLFDVWGHAFDSTRIDSVARLIRAAGVYLDPTIASMEQMARIQSGGFDSLLARADARRVGPATLGFWCEVSATLRGTRAPAPGVRFDPWTDFQLRIIVGLRKAGVPLLAGTDYPNATLAPGSGLHEELRALTDAGLTPFESLAAATITAGRALGDSSSGVIRGGARADLVLLRENPLSDLRALETIDGVMGGGAWLPRAELDRIAPERTAAPACAP